MEKQHNRGQDGAGIATIKLDVEPGYPFLYRLRSSANQPIADLFFQIGKEIEEIEKYQPDIKNHPGLMKGHINYLGELLLGPLVHLAKANDFEGQPKMLTVRSERLGLASVIAVARY